MNQPPAYAHAIYLQTFSILSSLGESRRDNEWNLYSSADVIGERFPMLDAAIDLNAFMRKR